jgi:hypothetical protein
VGHQIIKCPDGTLAIFSSGTETWILTNATPEKLLDYYAERAASEAREKTQRVLDAVLADDPCESYDQFTLTFEEADSLSAEHGGKRIGPG